MSACRTVGLIVRVGMNGVIVRCVTNQLPFSRLQSSVSARHNSSKQVVI